MAEPGHRRRARPLALALAALSTLVVACGAGSTTGASGGSGGHVSVVAAENFWGSIATLLGGTRVSVTSVVTDPNADPHDYQSSASTARAFATADYVVVNGAGYDGWADSLLNADHSSTRRVMTVADLIAKGNGDNPHMWYSPAYVERVADRITGDLSAIDPGDAPYFATQRQAFETDLGPSRALIAAIRSRYAGVHVASTESIFVYLADALGLDLVSPPEFMKAIAEGNDPPADTLTEFQEQLRSRTARVLVYNEQTSTDVTTNLKQLAAQQGIPVVGITETISPPDAPFPTWMTAELTALQSALQTAARTP